ncbi:hypothetical protein F4778DRAFT_57097 [Xylariomycetidae sp. FL2044]|nr:hypothetical protein F4778DRAFT_57097 [Xylariomycetidae sp. FL2044]
MRERQSADLTSGTAGRLLVPSLLRYNLPTMTLIHLLSLPRQSQTLFHYPILLTWYFAVFLFLFSSKDAVGHINRVRPQLPCAPRIPSNFLKSVLLMLQATRIQNSEPSQRASAR